jgi:hypothetical protein
MSGSTLRQRAKRAVGWPVRRLLDPRLDGLLNELTHRQDLSASATQESMEALAVGTRLLRGSVLDLADELHGGRAGIGAAGDLGLLRAAALGAVAASGRPRTALAVGEDMSGPLAAFGIAAADPAGQELVDLLVVVALELTAVVPVERLAPGGALVLVLGPGVAQARIAELTGALAVESSAVLSPAGAAGLDAEPGDPSRESVSRLIVARRQP